MLVLNNIVYYLLNIVICSVCIVAGCLIGSKLRKRKNNKLEANNNETESK